MLVYRNVLLWWINAVCSGIRQACQRHAILLTPHKRNGVERSVGVTDAMC